MDDILLTHFGELDGQVSLARFYDIYDGGGAGDALTGMVQAAVPLSIDLTKHALRALALDLRGSGMDVGGWRFEGLELEHRLHVAFTMAKEGAGYLVVVKLYPDTTEEASAKLNAFHRQRVENLAAAKAEQGLEGADYEKAKWRFLFTDPIPEEDAVKKDPASYKRTEDCVHVEEVLCVAFAPKGKKPEGRTVDECATLKEILANGFKAYMPSKIFEIRPDMGFDRGWSKNPSLPTLADVRDFEAALVSLRIAGEGIREAGLMSKVSDFVSSRKETQYKFIGDDESAPIVEYGAAAVVPEGIVTARTSAAVSALWQLTSALDARQAASDIVSVAGTLAANGHTSSKACYECNDADDFAWVEEVDEGPAVIWLRGQNGSYRIETSISDGDLDALRISRISRSSFNGGSASLSSDEKFICEFRAGEEGLEPSEFEEMTMRRIRDVNNVLFTLGSVACCLEEDYSSDADTAPA
jgi:hypothetical protein